jgi:3-deoxy-manno-octulosonate cytidylyltransferase (CMP-KDO synthetase)
MGTMIHKSEDLKAYRNPNVVKAVISNTNKALYFSRSSIPHYREADSFQGFWQHIGVYAFTKSVLENFCKHKPSSLEISEKLEQLRALENNIPICVTIAKKPAIGIDTIEDLEEAREYFIKLHPNLS